MKKVKLMMMTLMMCLTAVTITSCSKEKGCTDRDATNYSSSAEENDGSCRYTPTTTQCNCGDITSDGNGGGYYWVYITNSCSGNSEKFYLSESDWMSAYVGSYYCITNISSWRVGGDVTSEMIDSKRRSLKDVH